MQVQRLPPRTAPSRSVSINRASLSQQAVEELRRRIAADNLAPGQRLDEAELASDLASRARRCAKRSRCYRPKAWSRSVRAAAATSRKSCRPTSRKSFRSWALLEGEVAREAALKVSAGDLKRLDQLHASLERHAAAGDVDRYYEVNYVFHDALQGIAGNRWLQHVIGDLRKLLKLSRHRSAAAGGPARGIAGRASRPDAGPASARREGAERIMKGHLLAQLVALQRLMRGLSA